MIRTELPRRHAVEVSRLSAALLVVACLTIVGVNSSHGEDPFAAAIRPTGPLTAEEEQKLFHLPPGFQIQLFAAEPDLQKPLNMAFDYKGRLWVSGSVEYPYPAPLEKPGRDTIKILEDTNGDGRADKVTTFADGLNIPIGLYPFRNGVITFSIPNIYFLEDRDGDDHVDQRHILFGPLDYTRDTHGMNNAFRRGLDGWIYACHGYANQDTITARDGSSISMDGGASFRFRPDGSRVELFTRGQVNPFGLTMNARGDLFSADCHTKPIMLLLRGGCYENFGKESDGLGFVPPVMMHSHGSTAIAGTTVYEGEIFPPEYRGNMFAGNVMTSRVNRDLITFQGSTVIAHEQPDFVTTDDPWFRPVDLQVGPDGALYIADFYNRIIGHYEVPLDHPGRDRHRGRIWRVTYTGDGKNPPKHSPSQDLSKATAEQLVAALESSNLTLRLLATDALSDRQGETVLALLHETVRTSPSATARIHGLWALFRQNRLPFAELLKATKDSRELVRVHAHRIIAETREWSPKIKQAALSALNDSDGFVRRAAVDALGQHPEHDAVNQLIESLLNAPKDDVHLRHMARIALRQQLRPEGRLVGLKLADPIRLAIVADVALGIDTAEAGSFLADNMAQFLANDILLSKYVAHAARYAPTEQVEALIEAARKLSLENLELQVDLFTAVDQGVQIRGIAMPAELKGWGAALASQLIIRVGPPEFSWRAEPIGPNGQQVWPLEKRLFAGGTLPDSFLSSLQLGERYTGVLRSKPFTIPPQLEFYVCGHLGPPNESPIAKNLVRLKLVSTGQEIAQCFAPRDDIGQKITWNLQSYEGQEGVLEVVDGVKTSTYAWIGVGRFSPPVIRVPNVAADVTAQRCQSAAKLIARLQLVELSDKLLEVMLDDSIGLETQAVAAQSFVALNPQIESSAMAEQLSDDGISESQRIRILQAIAARSEKRIQETFNELMRTAPERLQKELASKLAEHKNGAETLLSMLERGNGTARLLQDETIVQKLQLAEVEKVSKRIESLTSDLLPPDEELRQLIGSRQQEFWSTDASPTQGEKVFAEHCVGCHQFRGRGATIGPQLDGIGNRGEERMIEDILDSNRNVDPAFQTSIYLLDDGRVISGLFRRIEGELTVIADPTGKEISFPTKDIDTESKSKSSLMPSNFGTLLPKKDLFDLVEMLREAH